MLRLLLQWIALLMMTGTNSNKTNLFSLIHSFLVRLLQGQNYKKDGHRPFITDSNDDEVQNRIRALKDELQEISLEKKRIEETIINCDWYKLCNKTNEERTIRTFEAKEIGDIPSLMVLKNDLLHRHELRLIKVEEDAIRLISDIRVLLSKHQLPQAKSVFDELNLIIAEVESRDIREAFKAVILQWNTERKKLEIESIRAAASQYKKDYKEETPVNPAIIPIAVPSVPDNEEFVQARYNELLERIKHNQSEEEVIHKTLASIDQRKKIGYRTIESKIKRAGISYLYHYTDKRNLASINKHGGLLSMKFITDHNIEVPAVIGDSISHNIDKDLHVDDYVKLLSFIDRKAINKLKVDRDMVVLKIDNSVLLINDSLYATNTIFDQYLEITDDNRILGGETKKITFLIKTFIPKRKIVEVINC